MIDSTVIRAHQHAAGAQGRKNHQHLGRSKGGFSTKIHVIVNEHGLPFGFCLTPGQTSDIVQAQQLIQGRRCTYLIGDRGYDADPLRLYLLSNNIIPVIPYRSNRKCKMVYDKEMYKKRNIVERFFSKIKQHRRLATRYEKIASMYAAMVTISCILLWITF